MADPCRTIVIAAPVAQDDPRDQTPQRTDRRFATKIVRISGEDLDDSFISDNISVISVEETARGLSKARVILYNNELRLTDHELFQANVKVEIFTGYKSTTPVKRGTFYCAKPHFMFKQGAALIELVCYGEEWPLTVSEVRQTYENQRDSEIVEKIATKYGLDTDIDTTDPIHEHVSQMNATDMEFLEERARLYGFDVYVSEGVLHFHAPRFTDSGLSLFYGPDQVSQLASFDVQVDPWMSGQLWTRSGIDRLSGKEWSFDGQDDPDEVSREIQSRSTSKFKKAAELAVINGQRPQRFIVGGGHEQTESDGKTQVQGYTRATEWVVHGCGYIVGVETLKARQLVEIVGVGHLSGFYYVTRAHHKIERGNYSLRFEGVRPGIGALAQPQGAPIGNSSGRPSPSDVTKNSPVVGTAIVGAD
jgi:hypothetical protein